MTKRNGGGVGSRNPINDIAARSKAAEDRWHEKLLVTEGNREMIDSLAEKNGTVLVAGEPGQQNLDPLLMLLRAAEKRDIMIITASAEPKLYKALSNEGVAFQSVMVSMHYIDRVIAVRENMKSVLDLSHAVANEILDRVSRKNNPAVVVYTTGSISLDQIDHVSSMLKAIFWREFISAVNPIGNGILLVLFCNDFDGAALAQKVNLADYMLATINKGGASTLKIKAL